MEECNEEQAGVVARDLGNEEAATAAGAVSRSTKREAIRSAAVENVAKRQFEKTASRAIRGRE
jgi:hypothetical protein